MSLYKSIVLGFAERVSDLKCWEQSGIRVFEGYTFGKVLHLPFVAYLV
jgi:hypothetical protein